MSVEAICRSPLDALIIPHRVGFVKGFFTFFFEPAQDRSLTRLLQSPRGKDTRLKVCTSLPLTMIVYHTHHQITRWNNAQNRDNYFVHFFRIFLLTNCWGYVIMEIPRPASVGAALKKPPQNGVAFASTQEFRFIQSLSTQGGQHFEDCRE